MPHRFDEIEQKFLVGKGDEPTCFEPTGFDLETFRGTLEGLGPKRRTTLLVRDTYYLLHGDSELVYRHRFDDELQELTVKSLGDDAQVRLEVNLDLGHHRGDQQATAEAFLEARGIAWSATVYKDIDVFHYPDCEVVYYRARSDERTLHCVEFEALHKPSIEEALAVLDRYRELTGFAAARREPRSLPQLMFPEIFDRMVATA